MTEAPSWVIAMILFIFFAFVGPDFYTYETISHNVNDIANETMNEMETHGGYDTTIDQAVQQAFADHHLRLGSSLSDPNVDVTVQATQAPVSFGSGIALEMQTKPYHFWSFKFIGIELDVPVKVDLYGTSQSDINS